MSPSVDDVLNCLQKYDEATSSRGARRKATHSLSKHHQCTEDPNTSGTRADAYVETPTEKYPRDEALYKFRRDAENCSKKAKRSN